MLLADTGIGVASQFVERGHLGGYVAGGDEATYYPGLWEWLVRNLDVKSVIDIGCGEGHSVESFRALGCRVLGVEGIPQQDWDIIPHDYTKYPLKPTSSFDLAWCCEFVEHVEERFVPNFLETFKSAKYVLMTHAGPGQDGYHHVNCKHAEYWVGVMAAIGYRLNEGLTSDARMQAALNRNPWNHFVRSGLAFERSA